MGSIPQDLGGRASRRSRLYKAKYKAGSGFIKRNLEACGFDSLGSGRSCVAAQFGFIKPNHKPDPAL